MRIYKNCLFFLQKYIRVWLSVSSIYVKLFVCAIKRGVIFELKHAYLQITVYYLIIFVPLSPFRAKAAFSREAMIAW